MTTRGAIAGAFAGAIAALCAGIALAQPSPGPAPEAGRLFFDTAERARLERGRGRKDVAATPADLPERVTISGLIQRPGRPPIPLINGRPLPADGNLSGLRIVGLADGRVQVTRSDGQSGVARPGQTVDLTTGDITESYDLQGRRQANGGLAPLPLPYMSGTLAPAAEKQATRIVKAKKPRKGGGRHGKSKSAGKNPKPGVTAAPHPLPQSSPMGAPAPAIPRPLPAAPAPAAMPR